LASVGVLLRDQMQLNPEENFISYFMGLPEEKNRYKDEK